jgi:hypothetical protein
MVGTKGSYSTRVAEFLEFVVQRAWHGMAHFGQLDAFALAWTALTDIQARVFHTAYIVFWHW